MFYHLNLNCFAGKGRSCLQSRGTEGIHLAQPLQLHCLFSSRHPLPESSPLGSTPRSPKSHPGVKRLAQPGMNFGSREKRRMANMQKRVNTACSANLWHREAGALLMVGFGQTAA